MAISTAGRGNLNQSRVARGIGGMGRFPGASMTGGTVPRSGLPCCKADTSAGCGVMTGGTGIMGINCGADQSVIVAVRTASGAGYGDDTTVNRRIHVQGIPVASMTGRTVAAGKHGFTKRQALEAAVCVVTGRTGVMGVRCTAVQGVVMTAGTVGRCNLNQVTVIRNVGGMGHIKTVGMTGRTISTGGEVFTKCNALEAAVGIVTTAASVVYLRITCIGQWWWIIVTGRTIG